MNFIPNMTNKLQTIYLSYKIDFPSYNDQKRIYYFATNNTLG